MSPTTTPAQATPRYVPASLAATPGLPADCFQNFAQYAGLIIYDRMTSRKLQEHEQYNWIVQQIRRMAQAADSTQGWGSHMFDYSGSKRCGRRWAHTPAVNPATGAIISKREFIAPRDTGLLVVPVPEVLAEVPETNCTIKGESF